VRAWIERRSWLGLSLGLGMLVGGAEVAARASMTTGMSIAETLQWWLAGVGMSVLLALAPAVVFARRGPAVGQILAVLLSVHIGMVYRFEAVVNRSLKDPAVWGGVLGIVVVAGLASVALHRLTSGRSFAVVRWSVGLGLLTLPVSVGRTMPSAPQGQATGPNILLITLDTLRPDRIGAYGSDNRTPTMDRLAKTGARFDVAVSPAPLTQPAHLAILSGRPPHVTGVVANGTDIGDRPALVQRVLQDRGYRTAGIVSGFPLHSRFGWDQGFMVYDDDFGSVPGMHRLNLVRVWDLVAQRSHTLRERRGHQAVDRAIAWLDRPAKAPFFLWLHLFDPHAPYEAPGHPFDPPTDGAALELPVYWPETHRAITSTAWLSAAYDAEVRFVDAQIGRLLAVLQHGGELEDTLIVLTADHGESLTEHGLLFDHGDDLFEPSLRVPLIVNWPDEVAAGQLQCLASNMDVTPTILGLLGIDDGAERHGVDRSDSLRGGECVDSAVLATTVSGRFLDPPPIDHALRWPGAKRILGASGAVSCWKTPQDVGGEVEMPVCPPGMDAAMGQALLAGAPPEVPRSDPETTEALRSLGYVE